MLCHNTYKKWYKRLCKGCRLCCFEICTAILIGKGGGKNSKHEHRRLKKVFDQRRGTVGSDLSVGGSTTEKEKSRSDVGDVAPSTGNDEQKLGSYLQTAGGIEL